MTTPMMAQWQACKKEAKGALVLFRLGDFYEAFDDDAVVLAKELDIVLTKRQETPMAGIPAHAAENYLDRLVGRGHRIAIVEQTEDAKETKGLVKREIVRILSPGSVIQSTLLKDKSSNFMAAASLVGAVFGLSLLDVTTADFRVMEFSEGKELADALARFAPQEFLVSEKAWKRLEKEEISIPLCQVRPDWCFDHASSLERLLRHFQVRSLDGFGVGSMTSALSAAGALLTYALDDLYLDLPHLKSITPVHEGQFLWLDPTTQRHLELTTPLHDKGKTLLSVLDKTVTPMGGRLFKEWLLHPLLSVSAIHKRQEAVEKYVKEQEKRQSLRQALSSVRDLERLIVRITSGYTSPRDLVGLKLSLEPLPIISSFLEKPLADLSHVESLIAKAVVDTPPLKLSEGGIFKEGYSAELDELRRLKTDSQTWLANYQAHLREECQIKTLKVGYTQAFGYYIEVSRGLSSKMPISFQRRQTLVNAERFISPELKEFEHKVLSAEAQGSFLENKLFQELRQQIAKSAEIIQQVARSLAKLDVILSFAHVADERGYCRPVVDESDELKATSCRHPVVEETLAKQTFVPNDVHLNCGLNRLQIITGPNMGGKSTFIRQAALLVLMAQIGSFVPAESAHVGIVDKIFTRIGASDDLSRGQSTFMVEMSETATILHHATAKSLVILDEIGRGTSTYDGIAIAWAVADHLLEKRAKTLFATHYFELTQLEEEAPGAVNYHVAAHEEGHTISFLHRILKGAADKSYGIHVAKLAGLPHPVVKKAEALLKKLHGQATPSLKLKECQLELF